MVNVTKQKEAARRGSSSFSRRETFRSQKSNSGVESSAASAGSDEDGGGNRTTPFKSKSKDTSPLPWTTLLAYAAPMIGAGGMNFTLTTFAAYFYTDTLGVDAGVVGNVQLVLMMMYAASEPIFGWLSDITTGWIADVFGRRKPYLAVSAVIHAATFFCLTGPPNGLTTENGLASWAFFFAAFLGLSWGCNEVTYQALGAQLTFDYDERTKLQAIAVSVITCGSTSCGLLHGILGSTLGSSTEATRLRFTILGSVYAGAFLIGTFLVLVGVKEEKVERGQAEAQHRLSLGEWFYMGWESLKEMAFNLPFNLLIVAYSATLMAGAVTPMLLPYFSKHVVRSRFATDWAPLLYTASAVVGMPIWVFLGSSYVGLEKKWRLLLSGSWLAIFLFLSAWLVQPGDDALFITFSVLGGLAMGGYFATPEAMKPDVVDYDEFRTGARHEARFAGVFMFFANMMAGVALEIMLLLFAHFGYDGRKEVGSSQPAEALLTIRWGFGCSLPILLFFIAITMVLYPITRKTHKAIIIATQQRLDGEYASDPVYGGPPLPPYENISITAAARGAPGTEFTAAESADARFLHQVGMEVGAMAGSHGDRSGIRNVP